MLEISSKLGIAFAALEAKESYDMLLHPEDQNPLISIILPTFNRRTYLPGCIESILSQTFTDWELIVIDDGSADESWKLIQTYVEENPKIVALKHQNKGLPLSRNAGIQLATGRYITFIDSDDRYKSPHLETRVQFMLSHPEVDLIHGGFEIIGDPYVVDKYDSTKRIHMSRCPLAGTIFGKREVFISLQGFRNIPYSEDSDLIERAESQFQVVKVDFPTYIYDKTTPGSITNMVLQWGKVA